MKEKTKRQMGPTLPGIVLYFFIKRDALAQVFSCKFCDMFQNSIFTEHLERNDFISWINI